MKKLIYNNLFKLSVVLLLILILFVLLFGIKIKLKADTTLEICAVVISILALLFSVWAHFYIVIRDKKIHTISALSRIRAKYPNLSSCRKAKCKTFKELQEKRKAYLIEMEFFCSGINEDIYDFEIVKIMSGHLLAKQYDKYMRRFAYRRIVKGYEYKEYLKVMDDLYNYYINKEELK